MPFTPPCQVLLTVITYSVGFLPSSDTVTVNIFVPDAHVTGVPFSMSALVTDELFSEIKMTAVLSSLVAVTLLVALLVAAV